MTTLAKLRVLIVDDSASVRQVLKEILESDPQIEVMGVAPDPYVAVERIKEESRTSSPSTLRCRGWMD